MSGPKVVRIVTREEILAVCEAHLRRLDQAIERWMRDGVRINELSDEEITATIDRRKVLGALLEQDAFMELQKKVPDEISFLKADLERRQQIAADKIAQASKRQRQGRDSASSLLRTLEVRGVLLPKELHEKLCSMAAGNASENVDSTLAKGFALLPLPPASGLSGAQRDLADKLMKGLDTQDFNTWKSTHLPIASNARIERIDHQIAELKTLLEADQSADFTDRLRSIETMEASSQQNLLLDSLILDLAAIIDNAREHRYAMAELDALAADLREYDSVAAPALFKRIEACNPSTSVVTINNIAEECRSLITQDQQLREAESRRKTILQGLAQLGYEVHEEMETAWARDGQVIAKKPSLPGYGVEIGGQAHTGRLQVRTVALTTERDIKRDIDVETIWCGEFSRLQALLAQHGNNLLIERSLGVGAVPLKVVSDMTDSDIAGSNARNRPQSL